MDTTRALLDAYRASKTREAVEQTHQVRLALEFCAFNSPDTRHPGSQAATLPGAEGGVALAGPGPPTGAESPAIESRPVAGMPPASARLFLGRCLELGHRLPHTWHSVTTGRLP